MARPGEGARETLAVGERGESIPLPQNWTRAGEDREEQEHDDLKTAGESGRDLTGVNPTAIPVPDGHQDPRGASPGFAGDFLFYRSMWSTCFVGRPEPARRIVTIFTRRHASTSRSGLPRFEAVRGRSAAVDDPGL